MAKMKQLEELVLTALEKYSVARQDDFVLYGAVLKLMGVPIATQTIAQFLSTARKNNIPAFESVSRCRRHIQEQRKDLIDVRTAIARNELQADFKNYNKTKIGEET